jgi:hypothetical protein
MGLLKQGLFVIERTLVMSGKNHCPGIRANNEDQCEKKTTRAEVCTKTLVNSSHEQDYSSARLQEAKYQSISRKEGVDILLFCVDRQLIQATVRLFRRKNEGIFSGETNAISDISGSQITTVTPLITS